jgi:hypothetical protein
MRGKLYAAGAATALFAALAPIHGAGASSGTRADFELGLTPATVAAPADLTLHVVYRAPGDRDAKPSPIRKVVIAAPPGTVFHVEAVPACEVSDDELMARGSGACPPESRVGAGKLEADTGFGPPVDPVPGDISSTRATRCSRS